MDQYLPSAIKEEVRQVLVKASAGCDTPPYLTAYQILDRLPLPIKEGLISQYSIGGAGNGASYSAISAISQSAQSLEGVDITYIDSVGLTINVGDNPVIPGNEHVRIFRLWSETPV